MSFAAYSLADPPINTNGLHETRASVLNDLETPAMHSQPQNRSKHVCTQNVSLNILKCVFRPKITSNASSQTKRPNRNTLKRPRILQHVFLSKYRLLMARDTLSMRNWGGIPRNQFLSTDFPEIRFKVKHNHRLFQSTSFNREFRETRFTTNIFPQAPQISNKLFEGRDSVVKKLESHAFLS